MAKWDLSKITPPKEPISAIAEMDREIAQVLDDGRPCTTDVFLAYVLEHEDDDWDLRARLNNWVQGDWAAALE